jgi:hypothetical protein
MIASAASVATKANHKNLILANWLKRATSTPPRQTEAERLCRVIFRLKAAQEALRTWRIRL